MPEDAHGEGLLDEGMYLDGAGGPKGRKRLVQAFVGWFGGLAETILGNFAVDKHARTQISMPAEMLVRPPRGSVATVLGPRSRRWFERAMQDPRRSVDIFPWWAEGLGRNFFLGRALSRMWLDVPWRAPADPHEREMMERVVSDLATAKKLGSPAGDPPASGARFPYVEWAELATLLGIDLAEADPDLAELAAESKQASEQAGKRRLPIGYRRNVITHVLPSGWCLDLPGAWLTWIDDESGRWVATDGPRTLHATTFGFDPDPVTGVSADSTHMLDDAPAGTQPLSTRGPEPLGGPARQKGVRRWDLLPETSESPSTLIMRAAALGADFC